MTTSKNQSYDELLCAALFRRFIIVRSERASSSVRKLALCKSRTTCDVIRREDFPVCDSILRAMVCNVASSAFHDSITTPVGFAFRAILSDTDSVFDKEKSKDAVTSSSLNSVFAGKSVNTAGFILAVLKAEGLVVHMEDSRMRSPNTRFQSFVSRSRS